VNADQTNTTVGSAELAGDATKTDIRAQVHDQAHTSTHRKSKKSKRE